MVASYVASTLLECTLSITVTICRTMFLAFVWTVRQVGGASCLPPLPIAGSMRAGVWLGFASEAARRQTRFCQDLAHRELVRQAGIRPGCLCQKLTANQTSARSACAFLLAGVRATGFGGMPLHEADLALEPQNHATCCEFSPCEARGFLPVSRFHGLGRVLIFRLEGLLGGLNTRCQVEPRPPSCRRGFTAH